MPRSSFGACGGSFECPDAPEALEDLLARMLAKAPEARPSAADVHRELCLLS